MDMCRLLPKGFLLQMLYYPTFITDSSNAVIGVYDKRSGEAPSVLKQLDDPYQWRAPTLHFTAAEQQVDAIVPVNMPLWVMQLPLANAIQQLAPDALVLLPIRCVFAGKASDNYCVLWPLHRQAVWDLAKSDWAPLPMASWPADRPFYLYDMQLIADVALAYPLVANRHHPSVLVVNDVVKQLIDSHCTTVQCLSLAEYRRDIRHRSSVDKVNPA